MFMHDDSHGFGGAEVPRPTTEERGANGYQAAMQWLDHEHIRTISLRERYDRLPKKNLPATGNVLIVTLPATAVFKTEEFRPLDHWVREGNTLLVLAALSDTPDWAFSFGGMTSGDLNLLTGLEFESIQQPRPASQEAAPDSKETIVRLPLHLSGAATGTTLVPNREHAYFNGVQQVVALTDYESQSWTVKVPYEGFVLTLAHDRETGEGAFWTRPLGNGRIIVSGLGTIFTNRALGLADNARLLSNIVATNLGPRGAVLFDDVHQGLGANYDPAKFYRDPRLAPDYRDRCGAVAVLGARRDAAAPADVRELRFPARLSWCAQQADSSLAC